MASREWDEYAGRFFFFQVWSGLRSSSCVLAPGPAVAFPVPSLCLAGWARGRENKGISEMIKPATNVFLKISMSTNGLIDVVWV